MRAVIGTPIRASEGVEATRAELAGRLATSGSNSVAERNRLGWRRSTERNERKKNRGRGSSPMERRSHSDGLGGGEEEDTAKARCCVRRMASGVNGGQRKEEAEDDAVGSDLRPAVVPSDALSFHEPCVHKAREKGKKALPWPPFFPPLSHHPPQFFCRPYIAGFSGGSCAWALHSPGQSVPTFRQPTRYFRYPTLSYSKHVLSAPHQLSAVTVPPLSRHARSLRASLLREDGANRDAPSFHFVAEGW